MGFLCCWGSSGQGSSGRGSSGRGSFVQDKKSGNNTQKTKHKDGPGVAAISKVSTFTDSSLGDIILPTFTASVIGPMESNLSVRALYDPGSQASYVREDVASALNASVLEPDITLCIRDFNSNKSLKRKRVQLSLSVEGKNHGGPSCVLESSLGVLLQGSAKQLIKNLPFMTNKNE